MSTNLGPKGTGHDQRKYRFLSSNPDYDRSSIPDGVDKGRLTLFLCRYKGEGRPLYTTMVKCRYCRTNALWYQPREDSLDFVSQRTASR